MADTTLQKLTDTPPTEGEQPPLGDETAEATGTETAEQKAEGEQEEEGEKKKLGGYQRKLLKLTREQELIAQERDYWRQQALKATGDKPPEEKAKPPEGKPKADDFDSQAEYIEALTDYKVGQSLKADRDAEEQRRLKSQREAEIVTFRERVDSTRKRYKDFDEVMEDAAVPVSAAMAEAINTSEQGPELAYWLAKHPADAARIAALPLVAASRELGKIEATFASETKPGSPRKQSVSLTPITTVNAPAGATTGGYVEGKTDYQEFKRLREAGKL